MISSWNKWNNCCNFNDNIALFQLIFVLIHLIFSYFNSLVAIVSVMIFSFFLLKKLTWLNYTLEYVSKIFNIKTPTISLLRHRNFQFCIYLFRFCIILPFILCLFEIFGGKSSVQIMEKKLVTNFGHYKKNIRSTLYELTKKHQCVGGNNLFANFIPRTQSFKLVEIQRQHVLDDITLNPWISILFQVLKNYAVKWKTDRHRDERWHSFAWHLAIFFILTMFCWLVFYSILAYFLVVVSVQSKAHMIRKYFRINKVSFFFLNRFSFIFFFSIFPSTCIIRIVFYFCKKKMKMAQFDVICSFCSSFNTLIL